MNILTLWHGGRDLEYNYRSFQSSKKGSWEHGPGIYLTTHYERAFSYAKGGGKTYLVQFYEGNNIDNVFINMHDIYEFVNLYVIKKKSKNILDILKNHSEKNLNGESINASYFLNIIIDFEAIKPSNSNHINQFLVNHGADYSIINHFGGRSETVFVIFNNKIIHKVNAISAKDVDLSHRELPLSFSQSKTLKM